MALGPPVCGCQLGKGRVVADLGVIIYHITRSCARLFPALFVRLVGRKATDDVHGQSIAVSIVFASS